MKLQNYITVHAHSGVRFGWEAVAYVDPFRLSAARHDADVILFTHDHYDHFSPEDAALLAKESTRYVMPASMREAAKKAGLDENRCVFLNPGDKTELCGIGIEAVASYNVGKPMHPKENGWLGYVLTIEGERAYIAGDMDENEDALAVSCDIALVPVGGTYTMNAKEAAAFVNRLRPKLAIPTHYACIVGSSEDGRTFRENVDPDIKVMLVLNVE